MSEQKVSEALTIALSNISILRDTATAELAYRKVLKGRDLALQLEQDHARLTAQVGELQAVITASENTNAVNQLVMALNKRVNDLIAERDELQKEVRVVAAVIEKDGRVLIFKRGGNDSYAGKWEFPGGKMEQGESSEDALRRELKEELNVSSVIGEKLDHYFYKYPKRSPTSLTFFAVDLGADPELLEHTESAWVSPEQLCDYDLLNGDMKFVATRYAMQRKVHELQKQLDARWRPISTAPKDGTNILALVPGSKSGILILHWGQQWLNNHYGFREAIWHSFPTHWMPLPAPPKETA